MAEAGYGPSLNLKDCSWPYVLLMRLGMYLLEILVHAVKVPRNTLNPRLPSKLIPVLYHIYSFRSSWQVSLIPWGGLWDSADHHAESSKDPFPFPMPFFLRDFKEHLVLYKQWISVFVVQLGTRPCVLPGFPLTLLLLTFASLILSSRLG